MIVTYRYLNRKYKQRKASRGQHAEQHAELPPSSASGSQPQVYADAPLQVPQESSEHTVSAAPGRSSWQWKAILLIGLAIPVFLETLDYTVVATAQTHIASEFNRLDLQSYIGTVYLLTSTVFLPLFASVADIFGRHITLQISLFVFMVGSAISTGAHSMATMLVGRGVAGVGAAGMLAGVRIILTDSRSLDDNNWQQSVLFVLYTIGYCVGPFIGGELVGISFRWIFAINLPAVALAMPIAFFLLRRRLKTGRDEPRLPTDDQPVPKRSFLTKLLRIDWIGAALFMAGGILVLLALNWGSTQQWNTVKVIVSFVVGGVLLFAFLEWQYILERKEETATSSTFAKFYTEPMIPLALFRSYDVCAVQYAGFVSGMILFAMFYFVAIFFTVVAGYAANKAGVQLIYFAPGLGGGSILSIIMVKHLRQPKIPIILGGIISTVALGLISMAMEQNNQNMINGFMAMTGVGVGLSIGPLAVHARFSQPDNHVAVVSALTLFFRSLGGTVGLAQCGAVLNGKVNSYIINLINSGAISPADASSIATASGLNSLQSIAALPPQLQSIVQDAFREGTRWCFISLIPWSGVALIATLFLSDIQDRAWQDQYSEENVVKEEERKREEDVDVDVDPLAKGSAKFQ